jgi:hypothetical protein
MKVIIMHNIDQVAVSSLIYLTQEAQPILVDLAPPTVCSVIYSEFINQPQPTASTNSLNHILQTVSASINH